MIQVERYIDDYYGRIEGIKLIGDSSVVLDNLLIKIVEDRPNQKKYVYSFYANHMDIAKADMMILHEMCWDKAADIHTLWNDSALRNHVRKQIVEKVYLPLLTLFIKLMWRKYKRFMI